MRKKQSKGNNPIHLDKHLESTNLVSMSVAIIIFGVIILTRHFFSDFQQKIYETESKAQMLAENISSSLLFDDRLFANDILKSLIHSPDILSAKVFDLNNEPFVYYGLVINNKFSNLVDNQNEIDFKTINIITPIKHNQKLIGNIYLRADFSSLYLNSLMDLLIAVLIAFIALLSTRKLLKRLNYAILKPLSGFTAVMHQISNNVNYDVKMKTSNIIELNVLTDGFNEMITELKERDERLTKYSSKLELEVTKRTHELSTAKNKAEKSLLNLNKANKKLQNTQAQLIQTAKLASVGELATGVAHELNQPLSIISLNADLRLKDARKSGLQKMEVSCETILSQVERATAIINHLRTFGRESSDLMLLPEDINKLIAESFILLNEQLREHEIKVIKELADNLPKVICNRIQIEQVLTNFIINARDALEFSINKQITVRTLTNKKNIVIEIEDTGKGVPKQMLDKIFDPFFTTKDVGKGTGLGLSISYGIIKEHHGSIVVNSDKNKGTNFRIELPIKMSHYNADKLT